MSNISVLRNLHEFAASNDMDPSEYATLSAYTHALNGVTIVPFSPETAAFTTEPQEPIEALLFAEAFPPLADA